MLGANFMGLYGPTGPQGHPPGSAQPSPGPQGGGFPALNGLYGMGAMPYAPKPAAAPQDPWAAMQPKLDEYLKSWAAKNAPAPQAPVEADPNAGRVNYAFTGQ